MSRKDKKKIKFLSEKLDDIISECQTKDDLVALSSLMLVYARKLLSITTDEEVSNELILYYISNKIYTKSKTNGNV